VLCCRRRDWSSTVALHPPAVLCTSPYWPDYCPGESVLCMSPYWPDYCPGESVLCTSPYWPDCCPGESVLCTSLYFTVEYCDIGTSRVSICSLPVDVLGASSLDHGVECFVLCSSCRGRWSLEKLLEQCLLCQDTMSLYRLALQVTLDSLSSQRDRHTTTEVARDPRPVIAVAPEHHVM